MPQHSAVIAAWCAAIALTICSMPVVAQMPREAYLDNTPLAEVKVQPLNAPKEPEYDEPNVQTMYQPLAEDPLSFYSRTQDGEWQIPPQVNPKDPWVRILILSPQRPALVDVAIDINQKPFRAAREEWIDKLLSEAKETYLLRTGEAAADAAGIKVEAPVEEQVAESKVRVEDAPIEDSVSEESSEESVALDTGEEVAMVKAQARKTSSLFKRLINYLAADQATAEREEVRWLLAEWTGGPALMTLSPAFAWRRADSAPLWSALDLDGDGLLSSDEISKTTDTLKQADINRDEILNLDELTRLGKQHASQQRTKGYPLVVVLEEQTDWSALRRHLRTAYPKQTSALGDLPLLERIAQGDHSVNLGDLANLLSFTPDMVYRVTFEKADAKVELLAVGGENIDNGWSFHSATERAITLESHATYMELTAAQGEIDEANESGDMQQTQVSIGAVADGFPLFRLLDHDNNRQLTLRERRSIDSFLKSLDRDDDGQIEGSEIPTAIRLAVTLGPQSHVHLANAIAAQREHGEVAESAAPDWFVGMDRNRDGDLSRREFQGSPRQFAKYDKDGDGLISLLEIQAAESKN